MSRSMASNGARAVCKTETACHQNETHQQPEHADALADAMEREIEMRMQQQPRRIREQRDRHERGGEQSKKPG